MKKLILVAAFWLLFSFSASAYYVPGTNIIGTVLDLSSNPVTSGQVTLQLQPGVDTTISGTARFVPTTVTCGINASGQVKNLALSGACQAVRNSSLTPSGTYYKICIWPYNVKTSCWNAYVTSADLDISTPVPTPATAPAYSFVDTVANQTSANNTAIGGDKEFTGSVTFDGSLTGKNVASVRVAAPFTGADWCAKVAAAEADLGTTPGEIWLNQAAGTSACAADLTLTAGHVVRVIQGGTYALGTKRILLSDRSGIITPYSVRSSSTGVTFSYTGTGTAIEPATATAITYDIVLKGFKIVGTSSATGGINMQAANSWIVEDVGFTTFSGTGAIALWLHSETLAQQGTYWNHFKNLYFSDVDTCIKLSSDNLTHAPNANYFGGITECNSNVTGVYIQQGAQTKFEYLAVNQSNTCTYGYKDHGSNNLVYGRLEQAPGAGTCVGIIYDRSDGNNTNGLLNRFQGTFGNYATNVQEIVFGPSTVTGTRSNQVDYVGGQGFLSVDYNAGVGGGAFGLADAVKTFTIASGKGSAATDMARMYLGDSATNTAEFCYRTGSADTCNISVKGDGTLTGLAVKASGGQFQGASVLDLYANGANRMEIGSGGIYPFLDNTYDNGFGSNIWKVSSSYENRNPRGNVTLANGANADISRGTSTNLKIVGPTGVFSISGFTGGADGTILRVYNSVAFAMTITNNATSTAANRILTLTGADVTLRAGQSAATFQYDSAQSLWILIGTN